MSTCQPNKNCIENYKPNNCKFNLRKWTRLDDDVCNLDHKMSQSLGPGEYRTSNFHSCTCNAPQVAKIAHSQPDLYFVDGFGWVGLDGCAINCDSALRNARNLTNTRCKNQLFTRPYLTTPDISRGIGDQCVEGSLQEGQGTRTTRSCNTLSEVSINNYFQDLVPSVASEQNPKHIVQEFVDPNWIRGGAPSRQIVRNIDYRIRCGEKYCTS